MRSIHFLIIFTLVLFVSSVELMAQSTNSPNGIYASVEANFGVVMSESEYNNGAHGLSPGATVGYTLYSASVEMFIRNFELKREYESDLGIFDITIKSLTVGGGFRFDYMNILDFKLGFAAHKVEARYIKRDDVEFVSTIDGVKSGAYFGFGAKLEVYPKWILFSDFNFYSTSDDLSFFNIEMGIRYYI